ncbi:MAG TPA: winged helix-turn-helix domain-containing protein [Rhizomicrobium sp.]|jgi:DNA-binding winged helix-turn-helix (wHTH) protein/Tfp pilus assembly protein PilF
MDQRTPIKTLTLREWLADHATSRLTREGETRSVEPRVMDLLFLLAEEPGRVFTRAEIMARLWPDVTVSEDTLARYVFKLRRALDDDRETPHFVETIPKRGYRLIVADPDPSAALNRRAEEFYFQYTRADNEAAIALYERALSRNPDDAVALAGIANGLVQRAVRWLGIADGASPRFNLKSALESGTLATADAQSLLTQAQQLAERAVIIAPENSGALRALGLVLSAHQRFSDARAVYRRALAADPNAWGVLINLADVDGIEGHDADALQNLERAFAIMGEQYSTEPVQIRPWYAALGNMIANRHAGRGDLDAAEAWYRRVLAYSPFHEEVTAGLAALLSARGEKHAADALCRARVVRMGPSELCAPFLMPSD